MVSILFMWYKKSIVSPRKDPILGTKGLRKPSKYWDKGSRIDPQPETIGLPGTGRVIL